MNDILVIPYASPIPSSDPAAAIRARFNAQCTGSYRNVSSSVSLRITIAHPATSSQQIVSANTTATTQT